MHNYYKIIFILSALFVQTTLLAQNTVQTIAKNDEGWMRSEAKIYVVGAVVLTILAGLIIYVARLDRKIGKLEKEGMRLEKTGK